MRKIRKACMSLLTAAFALPAALSACGSLEDKPSEVPAPPHPEPSAPPREAFVDTEAMAAIDALYTGEADRTRKRVNLAQGLSYTLSRAPSAQYPDTEGKKLTDGVTNEAFSKTGWVGFEGVSALTVDLDLGESIENVAELDVGFLRVAEYGIELPERVVFSVSDDGGTYVAVGEMLAPQGVVATIKKTYAAVLPGTIRARYVRMAVSGMKGWTFIDEIGIYKYEGENTGDDTLVWDYYGAPAPEIGGEPTYWDASESDYNDTVNLVAGKPVQIELVDALQSDRATAFYNSPESNPALTDGRFAARAAYEDGAFFRFTQGAARSLYFDLGHVSAVTGLRASFLREDGPNVRLPAGLLVYGSLDGKEWKVIHCVDTIRSEGPASIAKIDESFDKAYAARFIRVSFEVVVHVYCDEIEILGRKNAEDAAALSESMAVCERFPQSFVTPDRFGGVENMLLSYNYNPDTASGGTMTAEDYLPYVGYYDREGNLADTFFDSFLYLPYGSYVGEGKGNLAAWRAYVDNVFAENGNINALSKAVGQVSSALGREVRASVFFSFLYTWPSHTAFGDVDGDGVIEDFSKAEDRKKAIKWIVDEQVRRFEEGGYGNLDLRGFYWYEEQITYADPCETELIRYAGEYVRSLGYKLLWIPWNYAPGYAEWKNLGFDLTCMQPNYAFRYDRDKSILYRTADTAKLLGMCVELEINDVENPLDVSRYKEYLAVGAETGYMGAVKIYYNGGGAGQLYKAYRSDNKYSNSVYHDTYRFAKGLYSADTESGLDEIRGCADMTLDCRAGSTVSGRLEIDTEAGYSVRLAVSPKYGALRLNADGSFSYTSRRNFKTTDVFYVCADYGYGLSRPIAVTVQVKP